MRKITEILRLSSERGLGRREIARSLLISHNTVTDVLGRAAAAGISWPLAEDLDEAALEARLYPPKAGNAVRPEPDPEYLHRELRRKGVTLHLLWLEYKASYPDGLGYTQFCARYRGWRGKVDLVMRQQHRAGEKLFVDFAGQKVPVTNPRTGEVREHPLFVATLGASSYTYAEVCPGEDLGSFLTAHVRALEALGGSPCVVVPDNTTTAITGPCFYEPDINPSYQELARHYGFAVLPTRVRHPRDKAKVEVGVQVAERWILASLRNRTFFSLAELNQAVAEECRRLNEHPFQKLAGSRRSLFVSLDRPALLPLPDRRYEFARWRKARVNIDYHVEVEHHFYSVPYQLVREEVDVRYTQDVVEILFRGHRVASHPYSSERGRYTTSKEHMPESHRRYLEWSPSRLISWGETVGPKTAALFAAILESRPHPEHGYRSCLGIIRLGRHYPKERLEAACARALAIRATSYRSVKSILEKGLDQLSLETPAAELPELHENIRGPHYYAPNKEAPC